VSAFILCPILSVHEGGNRIYMNAFRLVFLATALGLIELA